MGRLRINLFVFLILLVAGFFGFWGKSWAEKNHLIITEILPNPAGSSEKNYEFIELYNPDNETVNLVGWYFKGKTKTFMLSGEIEAKTYKAFYNTITLYNEKSTIELFNLSGDKIDNIEYPDPKQEDFSYSFDGVDWQWTSVLTPGSKNIFDEIVSSENKEHFGKLKINEIFPAPKEKNDGKEFVEIINISNESVNLSGMRIEDEKNHKVDFPEKILASKEIYFLEGNFELNNTTPDTAFLIDKDGDKNNPIDSVSYEKPKYDYSYAFNGSAWQWTSKSTKGAENQFDEILSGKIKKDKKIYAGIYAYFEAKVGDKAKKFVWNFGDGHKSYLRKTRHKYEKAGDYNATLKITGDGEDNILSFAVAVEDFKKAKIKIIGFSPNPAGKDSENEWIEIQNNTKKKINLKNWSIATGWEKLSNHPIKKDFILKPKETKKLTRNFCAFALGNKKAKIELRYPNGKTADKIKYDRKKDSVDEDEIYQKEGEKWQWVKAPTDAGITQIDTDETLTDTENMTEEKSFENIKPALDDIEMNLSGLGKYSEDPNRRNKYKKQIALFFFGSNINPKEKLLQNQEKVLGISTIKKTYIKSARENNPQNFSSRIWKKINAKMNQMVSVF